MEEWREVILLESDFRSAQKTGAQALLAKPWSKIKFAVIGLGLMGGSYAKALRRLGAGGIIGVELNEAVLRQAMEQGIIDVGVTVAGEELRQADVIICAVYPEAVASFVASSVQFFKSDVLLTDISGIKGDLPSRVQSLLKPGMEFISGHPMAGRQGSGLDMASADIFTGANYIIVPERHNMPEAVQWLEKFAKALGCRHTVQVNPTQHDGIIAYTSNLPHVLAVSLMDSASYDDKTKYFVAGSFRDGTRVADINPELWSSLFLANKDHVIEEIDKFAAQLAVWRQALEAGDAEALKKIMAQAAQRRKELY